MKLIAIGDTHGRDFWKEVIEQEKEFDKLIFIGDYWDSFDVPFEKQMHNFLDICTYKRDNMDKVVLLIGNHDAHYSKYFMEIYEQCSGFQEWKSSLISSVWESHRDLFQMAHLEDKYLFTHAGVTKTWINNTKEAEEKIEVPIDEHITDIWKHKQMHFSFSRYDSTGYGDHKSQSPIWVRPAALNEDAYGDYIQVVGHTGQRRIGSEPTQFLDTGKGYFIDTVAEREYLVIEDGRAHPVKIA